MALSKVQGAAFQKPRIPRVAQNLQTEEWNNPLSADPYAKNKHKRQLAASRHSALSLGSNACSWALQMCSWHAPGAASLLRHMSAYREHTNTSIWIQTGALEADLQLVPTYCTLVHITRWSWRVQGGLLLGEARQRCMPEHTKHTPDTHIQSWGLESRANPEENTPRNANWPSVLSAIWSTLQSHSQCSETQNPRTLRAGRSPPSEPLQLCFAPTCLTAFTCFSCLVLQWSALRDNPSAFTTCNCNSYPNRAFICRAQDVWIKQN